MTMQGPPAPEQEELNRIPDVKVPGLLNLLGLGLPQMGQNLRDRRQEAQLQAQQNVWQERQQFLQDNAPPGQPSIGAPSFKDFTVESIAQYQQTGDPNVLERWDNPLQQARQQLSEERFMLQAQLAARPSPTERAQLGSEALILDEYNYLLQDFRPGYVGFGVDTLGDLTEAWRTRFGSSQGDLDFVDWWTQYRQLNNQILRDRAGANLTESEARRYERNIVSFSDSPQVAARKLATQQSIRARGLRRKVQVMESFGLDAGDMPVDVGDMSDAELMEALENADQR